MSFLDTGSRNDVFSRCRLVERCLSQITYHGKTSYQDMISRKVILPRYDITERRLTKTWYHDKTSCQDNDVTKRRLSQIYFGKTSFWDILSWQDIFPWYLPWQDVFLRYHILARSLVVILCLGKRSFLDYHISARWLSVISYLGKTSFHDILSGKDILP